MVYLPLENGTQSIQVQTNSYGKQVGIEVYSGIIQPWEDTDWWARHALVARSPSSIVDGAYNPSITWKPDNSTSYATLVMVLRQYWDPNAQVDLTITTEVTRNSTVTK